MFWYVLIGLVVWAAIGYALFHFRYTDTYQIDELRSRSQSLNKQTKDLQNDIDELVAQNTLLKKKTTHLLAQNEDYAKLVSELSRYYFHLKEATQKVQELWKLLRVYDNDIDQKLQKVGVSGVSWVSWWVVTDTNALLKDITQQVNDTSHNMSWRVSAQSEKKFF